MAFLILLYNYVRLDRCKQRASGTAINDWKAERKIQIQELMSAAPMTQAATDLQKALHTLRAQSRASAAAVRIINIGVQKAHVAMTDMEVAMTDMENELALKSLKPVPKAGVPGERSHIPWRVLADPTGPLNIPNLDAAHEQVFGTQEDSCDAEKVRVSRRRTRKDEGWEDEEKEEEEKEEDEEEEGDC